MFISTHLFRGVPRMISFGIHVLTVIKWLWYPRCCRQERVRCLCKRGDGIASGLSPAGPIGGAEAKARDSFG